MSTDTYSNHRKIKYPKKAMMVWGLCCTMTLFPLFVFSAKAAPISVDLKLGKMADYGASPWYTDNIKIGTSQLKLSPDSGANFTWATSDLCYTDACNAHSKVNTSQPGFKWIDKTPTVRSFGPWGSMSTMTGEIAFNFPQIASTTMPFFASICYTGNQFKYLAWDGGIGFPATSDGVQQGSGFYFGSLYKDGTVSQPTFSIVTHPTSGSGSLNLGGEDPNQYIANSAIELQPNTTGSINYIWGTSLYSALLGDQKIPSLTNARFYLDTGSSLFKGDDIYLMPILEHLYSLLDKNGNLIFEEVGDSNGNLVSLVYRNNSGAKDYAGILPNFVLTMGQTCAGKAESAMITLNPTQYSYKVEEGERAGRWVPAFTVLNGVGGLLVGSTFMDLFYTSFNYVDEGNSKLTQGNMILYKKSSGESPQNLRCVSTPSTSPIAGTWYNSYCSQVTLSVSPVGKITGVYTSHTGSTGSSNVVGWVGVPSNTFPQSTIIPTNPNGIPVALGIQWRLINQPVCKMDGSWHWVSTFSGQYHPDQIVKQSGQQDYHMNQTLEILNGLVATSTVPNFTETAPKMWAQTLLFQRQPPSYCNPTTPPPTVSFTGKATDYISGLWTNLYRDTLILKADMKTGNVIGEYVVKATGDKFIVTGLADVIGSNQQPSTNNGKIIEQGVALTMSDENGNVLSMAGGVDLSDSKIMNLWVDVLTSTTWTNRFMESTVNNLIWTRVQEL